ncbi:hypothetical protein [Hyphomicrobium sp. CS1GBMeth3]|uniref:hypothetical protein n=1 Tax=Hyphomicrobium sp. CS1GBMeth3 TaxID=1892845 RepID=UPI001114E7AC|nr:hypothetical protein [Hyphomicrobium sp. CS1GBMeth3]
MAIWLSALYLFIAPLAASTPNPTTPPKTIFPADIASVFEAMMPTPSWKHSLRQVTAIESWLLSKTIAAGVVTTFVPIAPDVRVHCAPGAPGVLITTCWVVPFVNVAQAEMQKAAHAAAANDKTRMNSPRVLRDLLKCEQQKVPVETKTDIV